MHVPPNSVLITQKSWYADTGEVDAPGTVHIHGDTVDIFPAQATSPVRIEFFGDEIDRIRRMVAATGQTTA